LPFYNYELRKLTYLITY